MKDIADRLINLAESLADNGYSNSSEAATLGAIEIDRLRASHRLLYEAAHNAAGVLIACCKPAGGCDDDHAIRDAIERLEFSMKSAITVSRAHSE